MAEKGWKERGPDSGPRLEDVGGVPDGIPLLSHGDMLADIASNRTPTIRFAGLPEPVGKPLADRHGLTIHSPVLRARALVHRGGPGDRADDARLLHL